MEKKTELEVAYACAYTKTPVICETTNSILFIMQAPRNNKPGKKFAFHYSKPIESSYLT